LFVMDVDFLWCWQEFSYSGPISVLPIVSLVFLARAYFGPGLV